MVKVLGPKVSPELTKNRCALLQEFLNLFHGIADLSELQRAPSLKVKQPAHNRQSESSSLSEPTNA